MSRFRTALAALSALTVFGALLAAGPLSAQDPAPGGLAYSIELTGTIDPATDRWIEQALARPRRRGRS